MTHYRLTTMTNSDTDHGMPHVQLLSVSLNLDTILTLSVPGSHQENMDIWRHQHTCGHFHLVMAYLISFVKIAGCKCTDMKLTSCVLQDCLWPFHIKFLRGIFRINNFVHMYFGRYFVDSASSVHGVHEEIHLEFNDYKLL